MASPRTRGDRLTRYGAPMMVKQLTSGLFCCLFAVSPVACVVDVEDDASDDVESVEDVEQAFDDGCGAGEFSVKGGGHSWVCSSGRDCAGTINNCEAAYGDCSVEACGFN